VKSIVAVAVVLLSLTGFSHNAVAQIRPTPALRISVDKFLDAVGNDDLGHLRPVTTRRGYHFIVRALNNHKEASKLLKMIGTATAASHVHWTEITQTVARGKVKWVTIEFVLEQGKWKFNGATAE